MKMLTYLLLFIVVSLSGCTANAIYLTPAEVVESIATIDMKLVEEIDALDSQVRQLRQQVIFLVRMNLLEKPDFMIIRKHLLTADYYVAKAWSCMIEKSKDTKLIIDEGKAQYKLAVDKAVETVDKKNRL